jgi:hypothetical protein
MSNREIEQQAAVIIADLFSSTVLRGLEEKPPRRFLYIWEQQAVDWLREWQKRDPEGSINAWTASYVKWGPPPWRGSDQTMQHLRGGGNETTTSNAT